MRNTAIVTLRDTPRAFSVDMEFPLDLPLETLVPLASAALAETFPAKYSAADRLSLRLNGSALPERTTLRECGVWDGEILEIGGI